MIISSKESARHKWEGILIHAGIEPKFLRNKHGPCPVCGGTDRFRYDNYKGKGTYWCNQHGSGDGMQLLMDITGKTFVEAAQMIDEIVGTVPENVKMEPARPDPRIRLNWIRGELMNIGDDPAEDYLKSRNLTGAGTCLKFHPLLEHWDEGEVHLLPAMIAPIISFSGKAISYHVTYLDPHGGKADIPGNRKILPATEPLPGSAIRLVPYDEVIGVLAVAEGVETALAVTRDSGFPCWSLISASNMAKWLPPPDVKHFLVFGDHDANFTGQAAAFACANRAKIKYPDMKVEVYIPVDVGDYADAV